MKVRHSVAGCAILVGLIGCGSDQSGMSQGPQASEGLAASVKDEVPVDNTPIQPPSDPLLPEPPREPPPVSRESQPVMDPRRIVVTLKPTAPTGANLKQVTIKEVEDRLDLRLYSQRAGIFQPGQGCPPGISSCKPTPEDTNLAIEVTQPQIETAVIVVDQGFEARVGDVLNAIRSDPKVQDAQPEQIEQAFFRPNDPELVNLWALLDLQKIAARPLNAAGYAAFESAWDRARPRKQRNAVVAVLDTGTTAHPDLIPNTLPGIDFVRDPFMAQDGNGRDNDPADPGDYGVSGCAPGSGREKSSWHGTHVGGTIAAVGNNNYGVAGAGFDMVKVQQLRVLGRCGGRSTDIDDAIVWAAGGPVQGIATNPTPADVINLSLGAPGTCSTARQRAIDFATSRGVIVVAAAGNDNRNANDYSPAGCDNVVTVGAHDEFGRRADFSNFGSSVEIMAPGVGIKSTVDVGEFAPVGPTVRYKSGTSMAAPHVSAALAMAKAVRPSLNHSQIIALLKSSADPLGLASGCTTAVCGAGYLNVDKLVLALLPDTATPNRPPTTSPTPTPAPPPTTNPPPTTMPPPTTNPPPTGVTPDPGTTPQPAPGSGENRGGAVGLLELALLGALLRATARPGAHRQLSMAQ